MAPTHGYTLPIVKHEQNAIMNLTYELLDICRSQVVGAPKGFLSSYTYELSIECL
jgi:hypothetical protein